MVNNFFFFLLLKLTAVILVSTLKQFKNGLVNVCEVKMEEKCFFILLIENSFMLMQEQVL
jgi:hypothetical protein